jgi:hypothetical protein
LEVGSPALWILGEIQIEFEVPAGFCRSVRTESQRVNLYTEHCLYAFRQFGLADIEYGRLLAKPKLLQKL